MNVQIIEKTSFDVIGIKRTYSCINGAQLQAIPQLWLECGENGTTARICEIGAGNSPLGIALEMDDQLQTLSYMIAVQPSTDFNLSLLEMNPDLQTVTIPAAKWAIFSAQGALPHALQQLIGRIYREWFRTSGYTRAAGPDIECYLPGDPNASDYPFEIWIPVN